MLEFWEETAEMQDRDTVIEAVMDAIFLGISTYAVLHFIGCLADCFMEK